MTADRMCVKPLPQWNNPCSGRRDRIASLSPRYSRNCVPCREPKTFVRAGLGFLREVTCARAFMGSQQDLPWPQHPPQKGVAQLDYPILLVRDKLLDLDQSLKAGVPGLVAISPSFASTRVGLCKLP